MNVQKNKRLTAVMQLCMAAQEEITIITKDNEYDELLKLLESACQLAMKYME